ncbi:MAG: hypothetical protein IJ091_05375 [Oscillospiraceae bacterium]|nr:hypothetical protein [Oscillospiraceae bacterium]
MDQDPTTELTEEIVRLVSYDEGHLCSFDPASMKDGSPQGILYYDFATLKYTEYLMPGFVIYSGIPLETPVLYEDSIFLLEKNGFRGPAITELKDDEACLWILSIGSGEVKKIELDDTYYYLGGLFANKSSGESKILTLGTKGMEEDTIVLEIDLITGAVRELGEYSEERSSVSKHKELEMGFLNAWDGEDGYRYGYKLEEKEGKKVSCLYRREFGSTDDFELLIGDCYPEGYGRGYSGNFRSIEQKIYYTGVEETGQSERKILIFCYDIETGVRTERLFRKGEDGIPLLRYEDYLVIVADSDIVDENGHSQIRLVKEKDYLQEDPQYIEFAKE